MADFLPQASTSGETGDGHEPNVLVVRSLVIFAVALFAIGIFVEYGLAFVMRDYAREEKVMDALAPPKFSDDTGPFPAPRLQPKPSIDLVTMRKAELGRLNGYGWVDRGAGIAYIPIDKAMDMIAAAGLPAVASADPKKSAAAPPATGSDKPASPAPKGEKKP
jgi:hypothetical protein